MSDAECERRRGVTQVIFVIHGIRDVGHWTDKVARRVWKLHRNDQRVARGESPQTLEKVIDAYGYSGMEPFLLPFLHWKKVAWFMERFLATRAAYPAASFSCVAHSHGTYIGFFL